MGFSAHTKVLTVDGLKYVKTLTPADRVFTPKGPSRVTYCGFYAYEGSAVNVDQGVVIVGSHLMQSWLNGWLVACSQEEAAHAKAAGNSFGRLMIRDELISCVSHLPFVDIPADVAPKEMWSFGTENGLAMVGPYIARTGADRPEGSTIDESGLITGRAVPHWKQEYLDTSWVYKDHGDLQAIIAFYELCRNTPPSPTVSAKPQGAAVLKEAITSIVDTEAA